MPMHFKHSTLPHLAHSSTPNLTQQMNPKFMKYLLASLHECCVGLIKKIDFMYCRTGTILTNNRSIFEFEIVLY